MVSDNNEALFLSESIDVFSESLKQSVECMFGMETSVVTQWEVTERLICNCHHNILMGCGNSGYQGMIAMGLGEKDAQCFGFSGHDELLDVFGELLNNFCGILMDDECVTEHLGVLTQCIPQYVQIGAFLPKASSCSGYLNVDNGSRLFFGFSIKKNRTL